MSPVLLTSEFWDADPESYTFADVTPSSYAPFDAYALDTEDQTAEWWARATQAPVIDAFGVDFDLDDPAEIAADSMSMISEASRSAATFESTDLDDGDLGDPDER